MELMVVALMIWNLLISACLVGIFFRLRSIDYQLLRIHVHNIDQQLEGKE